MSDMIHQIARTVCRQLAILLAVALVALAVYVTLGRQLIPLAANYTGELEQALGRMTGMTVHVGAMEGRWERFNPRLAIRELALEFPGEEGEPGRAAVVDDVGLELDVLESLLQWRLVVGPVELREMELVFAEQPEGGWLLSGWQAGERTPDMDELFRLATRFSELQLSDSRIRLEHLGGQISTLENVSLFFQSRGQRHALQVDAALAQQRTNEPLTLSAELSGQMLGRLSGRVYLSLPEADYSPFLDGRQWEGLSVGALAGGTDAWLELEQGRLQSAAAELSLPRLSLSADGREEEVTLTQLAGRVNLQRQGATNRWQLWARDLTLSRDGSVWPETELFLESGPGGATLQASRVEMGMASGLLQDLSLLPERGLAELEALNPRGRAERLRADLTVGNGQISGLSLRSNLSNMRISAREGAPALWGVDGYAELDYSAALESATGLVEVDSRDLMLHLPELFTDIWAYDHVNGRVRFRVDTGKAHPRIRVSSNTIIAESEAISGRVRFATDWRREAGEQPIANLELMVGALEADGSRKSLYLPMAPGAPQGIQDVLSWVDEAVVAGDAAGSGLIFRGRVNAGDAPGSRTLQMFYHVQDGHLKFAPRWPALEQLDGHVVMDDAQVDVSIEGGSSLGIGFNATQASVRANTDGPGSWVTVNGQGTGKAGQGLEYLRQSPVTEGLSDYLSGWNGDGQLDFNLDLAIPLFVEDAEPSVNLRLGFSGNRLHIPQYALELEQLQGGMSYSTAEGLDSEELTGVALGEPVRIALDSLNPSNGGFDTRVDISGSSDLSTVVQWPMTPSWLKPVLGRASGSYDYEATLSLPYNGDDGNADTPSLSISSDLRQVNLDYPEPLGKSAGESLPMRIDIGFAEQLSELRFSLGDIASVTAELDGDRLDSGLVFLGPTGDGVRVRRFNADAEGLLVLGRIPRVDYEEWNRFLQQQPEIFDVNAVGLDGVPLTVDLTLGELTAYDQVFPDVNVQMDTARSPRRITLAGDAVAGNLRLPGSQSPLTVRLAHLRLGDEPSPDDGEPDTEAGEGEEEVPFEELPTAEYVLPREDPLAGIDPRQFPPLRFSVDSLSIDGETYGSWEFELEPQDDGALFTGLQVNSRGLRIGSEEEPGRFHWQHEGGSHHSELEATVTADNLADVLQAYGYAPTLESSSAEFDAQLGWDGTPGYFAAVALDGTVDLAVRDGRFLGETGAGSSALKLISIINLDAIVRRLRISDDLVRSGLAFDEIAGRVELDEGIVHIVDRLQIIGPSSLFQISGDVDLVNETIDGSMYITLPVSENIPWLGGLAALNNLINWQVAIGVFVLERIFGDQVDSLTSAQYILDGPWDELEPELYQVFSGGN